MISDFPWQDIAIPDLSMYRVVRNNYHQAVQQVGAVGRAYLEKSEHDENAVMQWVPGLRRLAGKWVGDVQKFRMLISFEEFVLQLVSPKLTDLGSLPLAGKTHREGLLWIEGKILELGLPQSPLSQDLPYEIPIYPTQKGKPFDKFSSEQCWMLGVFFHNTYIILSRMKQRFLKLGEALVWPHHFDMSAQLILRNVGNSTINTSVSLGFSPGDKYYDKPYFFVNSWPFVMEEDLAPLVHGDWHTEEWSGAVLTYDQLPAKKADDYLMAFYTEATHMLSAALLK